MNNAEASGVATIAYQADAFPASFGQMIHIGTVPVPYAGQAFAAHGLHTLFYASKDNAGNEEVIKSTIVFYDSQAPPASGGFSALGPAWTNLSTITFVWSNPSDDSGIDGTLISITDQPEEFFAGLTSAPVALATDRI